MKLFKRILSMLMATLTVAASSALFSSCEPAETTFVEGEGGIIQATSENTTMLGRTYQAIYRKYNTETKETMKLSDVLYFNWACSGFQVTFEGTGLKAQIVTNNTLGESDNPPAVYVAIDGKDSLEECKLISINEYMGWYTLCEGLDAGRHTVKVIRRDANSVPDGKNTTGVANYEVIDGNTMYTPPALRERKIEAWGDSITCGDGLFDLGVDAEGNQQSCSDGWQTYAAFTARALNAELNVVSISGNGLICCLFGSKLFELPARFKQTDEFSSANNKEWDFSKYQADVVLINLGTNDSAGVPSNFTFQEFEDEYVRWALEIKEAYPNCIIIGMLGMMNEDGVQKLYPSIENAAKRVNEQLGSEVFIPMWLGGVSTAKAYDNGHPGLESHKACSELIVAKIKEVKGWE